jgi:small conductance mechanosensitive channel
MERTKQDRSRWSVTLGMVLVLVLGGMGGGGALAQLSKLAGAVAPPSTSTPPAKGSAGATVATSSGLIKVDAPVDDGAVEKTLESLLPKYPGVRSVDATVKQGIVELDGQVDEDDTRDQMTEEAKHIEGVRMVINRMKTDAEVLTAPQYVLEMLRSAWDVVSRRWLMALLALATVLAFAGLARLFNAYSETLLSPFLKNVMLRSVVGSLINSALLICGLMLGLAMLNLTHAVLSIIGLAGVVGLAVGFAFKDITENFIASVLLGVRRPFRVGDYVTVAGQTGVIRSLNTRATVLVTLEGNHVRIPNNIVYKEILINATASPSFRGSSDVVIPFDASTAAALDAMNRALHEVDGVLPDPPPRALIEALEPGGIRLRAYYWAQIQNVDWLKLNSDAKLHIKVALQKAGVLGTRPPAAQGADAENGQPQAQDNGARAQANLRRDSHAAETARAAPANGQETPMQRALNEAESRVSEEGTNLLAEAETGPRET